MKGSASFIVVACVLVFSVAPAAAQVPDLTGTWTGRWSCKSFDGTKFNEKNKASTLRITQSGGVLAAHIDGPLDPQFFYNGAVIADDKKPDEKGEVVMNQCGTDNLPVAGSTESEIVRAQVKTKLNSPKASFKGTSVFENDGPTVGTCRYSFKRLDTADPGIAACL